MSGLMYRMGVNHCSPLTQTFHFTRDIFFYHNLNQQMHTIVLDWQ